MSVWTPASDPAPVVDLPWLHADRLRAWTRVLAAVTFVVVAAWVAMSRGGLDPTGKPLGTDFVGFWSASRLALEGAPAAAYDPARHGAMEAAAFPGSTFGYAMFPYPPPFLLVCLPLGLLPYFASLIAWMGLTGAAYWRVARGWLGGRAGELTLAVLAFPAVLINLAHGQNAFLTTALFGGGALMLQRRPLLAGLCLGLLVFKPHLGLLIPVALLAARQWRAVAGAALGAAGLCLASLAVLGPEAWLAFPHALGLQRAAVEQGLLDPAKVQTLFAALRLWNAPAALAYAAQGLAALAAAATVGVFAWRHPDSRALGPVLIAATLLVSPYMLDYDLVLAAVPLAWLLADGQTHGFRRGDKAVMLAAYVLPMIARVVAMQTHVALSPFVLAALLFITVRRAWTSPPLVAA